MHVCTDSGDVFNTQMNTKYIDNLDIQSESAEIIIIWEMKKTISIRSIIINTL